MGDLQHCAKRSAGFSLCSRSLPSLTGQLAARDMRNFVSTLEIKTRAVRTNAPGEAKSSTNTRLSAITLLLANNLVPPVNWLARPGKGKGHGAATVSAIVGA